MFRLFGFLLGSVLSGGALYYYVVDEYKISNAMLNEDLMVSSRKRVWKGRGIC